MTMHAHNHSHPHAAASSESPSLDRLEVLAAFLNSATLLIVSTLICREAIVRLLHPEPIRGGIMLTVALVGLVANLASVFLLKGHHHGDLNMRGAFLHLVQDTVSSVAVVLAALLAGWKYGPYLDPVVSILVEGRVGSGPDTGH